MGSEQFVTRSMLLSAARPKLGSEENTSRRDLGLGLMSVSADGHGCAPRHVSSTNGADHHGYRFSHSREPIDDAFRLHATDGHEVVGATGLGLFLFYWGLICVLATAAISILALMDGKMCAMGVHLLCQSYSLGVNGENDGLAR